MYTCRLTVVIKHNTSYIWQRDRLAVAKFSNCRVWAKVPERSSLIFGDARISWWHNVGYAEKSLCAKKTICVISTNRQGYFLLRHLPQKWVNVRPLPCGHLYPQSPSLAWGIVYIITSLSSWNYIVASRRHITVTHGYCLQGACHVTTRRSCWLATNVSADYAMNSDGVWFDFTILSVCLLQHIVTIDKLADICHANQENINAVNFIRAKSLFEQILKAT